MKLAELFANAYTTIMTALGITEEVVEEKKEEEDRPWLKAEERSFPTEEEPVVKETAASKRKRKPALKISRGEILKIAQDYATKYNRFPSLKALEKESNGRITKQRIYKHFKNLKGLRDAMEFSVVKPGTRSVRSRVPEENPKEFLMNDLYQNVINHPEERAVSTIIDKYCTYGYDTYLRHIGVAATIAKELEMKYGLKMRTGYELMGKKRKHSKKEYSKRYCDTLRKKLILDYCNVRSGFTTPLTYKEYDLNSAVSSVRNYIYRIYDHNEEFLKEAEAYYQKEYKKAA